MPIAHTEAKKLSDDGKYSFMSSAFGALTQQHEFAFPFPVLNETKSNRITIETNRIVIEVNRTVIEFANLV